MAQRMTWWLGSAVVAALIYALMWVGYRARWAWLHWVDVDAVAPVHGYASMHPGWVTFWTIVCTAFGPEGFRVLGLVIVVLALLWRDVRAGLFVLACIGLSGTLGSIAKGLADRPRPADALATTASSSFPSGHAVAAMAGVLALLAVTRGVLGRALPWAVVAGAVIVAAVGFGRVALGVHYPSDVVAGWALGYLWFLVCLVIFRPRPLTRAASRAKWHGHAPLAPERDVHLGPKPGDADAAGAADHRLRAPGRGDEAN
jgi:membrane-associated phospholipid phosphatase